MRHLISTPSAPTGAPERRSSQLAAGPGGSPLRGGNREAGIRTRLVLRPRTKRTAARRSSAAVCQISC